MNSFHEKVLHHGKAVKAHVKKHHKKYLGWFFAGFAVFKTIKVAIVAAWLLLWLNHTTTTLASSENCTFDAQFCTLWYEELINKWEQPNDLDGFWNDCVNNASAINSDYNSAWWDQLVIENLPRYGEGKLDEYFDGYIDSTKLWGYLDLQWNNCDCCDDDQEACCIMKKRSCDSVWGNSDLCTKLYNDCLQWSCSSSCTFDAQFCVWWYDELERSGLFSSEDLKDFWNSCLDNTEAILELFELWDAEDLASGIEWWDFWGYIQNAYSKYNFNLGIIENVQNCDCCDDENTHGSCCREKRQLCNDTYPGRSEECSALYDICEWEVCESSQPMELSCGDWDNDYFLTGRFWTLNGGNPTNDQIRCALYGASGSDTTAYTKYWSGWIWWNTTNSGCDVQNMNVVRTWELPVGDLSWNTIYVLTWLFISRSAPVTIGWEMCVAIISNTWTFFYSTWMLSNNWMIAVRDTHGSIIIDNISIDWMSSGNTVHSRNYAWISFIPGNISNVTINNVNTYWNIIGISANNLNEQSVYLNNFILNNVNSYNNSYWIVITWGNNWFMNNMQLFRNISGVVNIISSTGITINNSQMYKNFKQSSPWSTISLSNSDGVVLNNLQM